MTSVRLDHISKHFDATVALDDINLEIAKGELFFLLGPSGCGKSTLLRLIAGLYQPTSGRIFFNDRDVTFLRTEARNAVMCFQSYALWPHMTVRENIRFGLQVRHLSRSRQQERIESVLKLVQMESYAQRKPNQLSGGQQQRVALARALAVNPDCLLLDEPLSNLDAKLRHEMRGEVRRICKSAGYTTIYVTHDQKEALSIADRIAVLRDGRVLQVGTPAELYRRPRTSFVADFIGQTNLLRGRIIERNGQYARVQTEAGIIAASAGDGLPNDVIVSIRPEQMRVRMPELMGKTVDSDAAQAAHTAASGINILHGKTVETTFLGDASEHVVAVNGQDIRVVSTPPILQPPQEMILEFRAQDAAAMAE